MCCGYGGWEGYLLVIDDQILCPILKVVTRKQIQMEMTSIFHRTFFLRTLCVLFVQQICGETLGLSMTTYHKNKIFIFNSEAATCFQDRHRLGWERGWIPAEIWAGQRKSVHTPTPHISHKTETIKHLPISTKEWDSIRLKWLTPFFF